MAGKENRIPGQLLEKYLSGGCSEEEAQLIEEWYASFEEDEDGISMLNDQERKLLEDRLLDLVHRRIATDEGLSQPFTKKRVLYPALLKVAASLVLAASLVYVLKFYTSDREAAPDHQDAFVEFSNTGNSLAKQVLPDGSVVWLYPESEIRYPREGRRNSRELYLSGEAFFDVSRDTLRPFLVYSGEVTTKVLGTSFTIKAYRADSTVQVHVLSGKVAVEVAVPDPDGRQAYSNEHRNTVLVPNESAVFSRADRMLTKDLTPEKPKEQVIWSRASLSFSDASIGKVLDLLSRQYGIVFDLSNEDIKNCTITADFTNQNLPAIVEIIGKTIMAGYTIRGDTITISGEGCEAIN